MPGQRVSGKMRQPAEHGHDLPACGERLPRGVCDQRSGVVVALSFERVPDGVGRVALPGEPPRRRVVLLAVAIRVVKLQALAQKTFKQVVVAIHGLVVRQWNDEQAGVGQPRQHGSRIVAARQRAADVRAQPVEHAGVEQELLDLGGLLVQNFGGEVVEHMLLRLRVRGEMPVEHLLAQARRLGAQRHQDQGEGRRPALGRGFEPGQHRRGHRAPDRHFQQMGDLRRAEPQIAHPHLGDLAARAQAGELKRRVGARAERNPHVRRQVLGHHADGVVDLRVGDQVVVVEHQRVRRVLLCDGVENHRGGALQVAGLVRGVEGGAGHGKGLAEVGGEAGGVVVLRVERVPPHMRPRLPGSVGPLGEA